MHWISLPLAATALAIPPSGGAADTATESTLPPTYLPCEGSVPVFNPQGCPPPGMTVEEPSEPAESACRDRIALVREAQGQPRLERQLVNPERPHLIAAVDKRIDGCAVMQMHHDVDDLRPLPARPDGPAKVYRGG